MKKRQKVFLTVVGILISGLFLSGCYYDVEEELYPDTGCDLEGVSYSNTVLPILQTNCYGCHDAANNFGGITIEGFDQLKIFVENGQFIGAIKHKVGFSPMPKNSAQLLDCEIEKIEKWVADGAPNN